MINVQSIIDKTIRDFKNNKDKLDNLLTVSDKQYHSLHTSPLIPLDIKIDIDLFKNEIKQFENNFQPWDYQDNNRLSIPLVNFDGLIIEDFDPTNGSLHRWNQQQSNLPLIESDFLIPTTVMEISSLSSLRIFDTHWCRSNILKWNKGAEFKPHIDAVIPSPWLRLWGTDDASKIILNFYNNDNQIIDIETIESGRIYLIDTSLVHEAICTNEIVYQFFLSVLPSSYDTILKIKMML